jgi:hypothetical protein
LATRSPPRRTRRRCSCFRWPTTASAARRVCARRCACVCVWCVVCGVWCVVCGVWCVVCGVWCVVCGVCVVCSLCACFSVTLTHVTHVTHLQTHHTHHPRHTQIPAGLSAAPMLDPLTRATGRRGCVCVPRACLCNAACVWACACGHQPHHRQALFKHAFMHRLLADTNRRTHKETPPRCLSCACVCACSCHARVLRARAHAGVLRRACWTCRATPSRARFPPF